MFAKLVARLDYPMYVVTTTAGGERSGCLVGFGTQTSIHPPRFLACISKKNHTYGVALRADVLAVHFLSDTRDERAIAEVFGSETGDTADKFTQTAWHDGPGGVPYLDGIPNRFAGHVVTRFDMGDHDGFLLDPIDVETNDGVDDELGFQKAKRIPPGHEA